MKSRLLKTTLVSLFLLFILGSHSALAQKVDSTDSHFSIDRGRLLTGFSVDGVTASRDDYNHEFERGFSQLQFSWEALYFVSKRVGIGPVLGYGLQYRYFDSSYSSFGNQWNWSFLYGVKAGWYVPVKNIFRSDALDHLHNAYLFFNGGVSWSWTRSKTELYGKTSPENRFGYQLNAGVLAPLGRKIALEWKVGWNARRESYRYNIGDGNGHIVRKVDETKWLKNLSLGIGLKIIF